MLYFILLHRLSCLVSYLSERNHSLFYFNDHTFYFLVSINLIKCDILLHVPLKVLNQSSEGNFLLFVFNLGCVILCFLLYQGICRNPEVKCKTF